MEPMKDYENKRVTPDGLFDHLIEVMTDEKNRTFEAAKGMEPILVHADAVFGMGLLIGFIKSQPMVHTEDGTPTGQELDLMDMFKQYFMWRIGKMLCPSCGKPWSEHGNGDGNVQTH